MFHRNHIHFLSLQPKFWRMDEFAKYVTTTEQDTVGVLPEIVPPKPTYEQIRYWQWQREKKLLINDSRYIPSKDGNVLVLTEELEPPVLQLPSRAKTPYSNDWFTVVLLLALVLLASVRVGYAKYIGSLFQSVFNYPTAYRMFGEKNYSLLHGAFRLEALFYLVLALFIYQLIVFLPIETGEASLIFYGKTLGFVVAYFLLKKLVYRWLGNLFRGVGETAEFLFNYDNFNRATGILLFPIVALIAFIPSGKPLFIIVFGVVVVSFFYMMLLKRGISIVLKKQVSLFYLFLYLCSLEFLPLLLVYKIVVD